MFRKLLIIATLVAPLPVSAWGPEGHEIVANIALEELTPVARAQVAAILGSDTMMVHEASWADEVRQQRSETGPWHYVDIPLAAPGYDAARDCPAGDCVVVQIEKARAVVGDLHAAPDARRDALRFLIHIVADVHQPLHAEDNQDHGGNMLQIRLGVDHTNLHHIWDTQVVMALGNGEAEIASELDHSITAQERRAWQSGSPADWANESHAIARDMIYPPMGGHMTVHLPMDYARIALPLTRMQLQRAGLRLAWLLNMTLK